MKKERHVLLVFPHPDDEAFSTAGTVLMHRENGIPVTYACLTLGEMGRNLGNPPVANRETLPLVRKQELLGACQAMKIEDVRMLGYRDKTLEFLDPESIADRIEQLLQEIQPSLVLTFYPGYGVHPDHNACGEAVVRAVKRIVPAQRPTVYTIAITKDRFEKLGQPEITYHVERFLPQKMQAIQAHQTQMQEVAAFTDQKLKAGDQDISDWLQYERFWIYPV